MYSSRIRTGHSLTVCWSLLPGKKKKKKWGGGGGVSTRGGVWSGVGCLLQGGVYSGGAVWSGGCLVQGVSGLGGVWSGRVWSGGCLLQGGLCSGGVSAPGGSSLGGVSASVHAGIHPPEQTPPPVNRMTDACKNITLAQLRCGR